MHNDSEINAKGVRDQGNLFWGQWISHWAGCIFCSPRGGAYRIRNFIEIDKK